MMNEKHSLEDATRDVLALRDIMKSLDKFKAIPLSNYDIMNLVEGKANVVLYRELHKFMSIDEVFNGFDACFLLYESKPNYGHWCCMTLRDQPHKSKKPKAESKRLLEFFDPYGGFPDTQLKHISVEFRKESNQDVPYLSTLLYEAGSKYSLSYNEFQFQKLKEGVADCGRWCSVRIMLKELPLREFKALFLSVYSDDIVTLVTTPTEQLFEYTEKSTKVI